MGSPGSFPVKNSQSTARLSANSAADPAKTRSTMSPSPQILRTMESCLTKSVTIRRLTLSHFRLLEPRDVAISEREVHDPARSESGDHPPRRKLHTVGQLALAVHDIVDRHPIQTLRRSDPQVAFAVYARRTAAERWLVVGKLARINERHLRELSAEWISARPNGRRHRGARSSRASGCRGVAACCTGWRCRRGRAASRTRRGGTGSRSTRGAHSNYWRAAERAAEHSSHIASSASLFENF